MTTWWPFFQLFSWDLIGDLVYKKGHFPPTILKKLSWCNQFTKTQGTLRHLHHSLISDSEKAVFLTKKTTSSSSKTEALDENIWRMIQRAQSWHLALVVSFFLSSKPFAIWLMPINGKIVFLLVRWKRPACRQERRQMRRGWILLEIWVRMWTRRPSSWERRRRTSRCLDFALHCSRRWTRGSSSSPIVTLKLHVKQNMGLLVVKHEASFIHFQPLMPMPSPISFIALHVPIQSGF